MATFLLIVDILSRSSRAISSKSQFLCRRCRISFSFLLLVTVAIISVTAFLPSTKPSLISTHISANLYYNPYHTPRPVVHHPSHVQSRWTKTERQLLVDVIMASHVFFPVIPYAKIAQHFFKHETEGSLMRYWVRVLRPLVQNGVYPIAKDLPPHIESFIMDLLANGTKRNSWTLEEDAAVIEAGLQAAVTGTWTGIEFHSLNRTQTAIKNRFAELRKLGKAKNIRPSPRSWSAEGTQLLVHAINLSSQMNKKGIPWQLIQTHLFPDRSLQSLRNRWMLMKKKSTVDTDEHNLTQQEERLHALLTAIEAQSTPAYRSKIWSAEEDETLSAAVVCFGRQWKNIAETCFNNQKTAAQCQQRWLRQLAPHEERSKQSDSVQKL